MKNPNILLASTQTLVFALYSKKKKKCSDVLWAEWFRLTACCIDHSHCAGALNQWDTYDFCGVTDTFLGSWNLFLDCLEKQPNHATVTGNQTGREGIHMKVFTGPYSVPPPFFLSSLLFFSLSCTYVISKAVEALWFWPTGAANPVVPVVGRGIISTPHRQLILQL